MSDRVAAKIEIGGKIPAKLISGLLKAITTDAPRVDWGGPEFEPKNATALVQRVQANAEGLLKLYDEEASGGTFEAIEDYCCEYGIAFNRHSSACADDDAELCWFRAGMAEKATRLATEGAEELVLREPVAKVLEELRAARYAEATTQLQELLGDDIPPLLPFVIVKGTSRGRSAKARS